MLHWTCRLLFVVAAMGLLTQGVQAEADIFSLAKEGTAEQVQAAIRAGADVNAKDEDGNTPLMRAARYNDKAEVIKALIDAGADVHARNNLGVPVLRFAVTNNPNPQVISALLEAGADFKTKLSLAARNSNPEVIAVLIKAGAEVNAKDSNGRTPLMFAAASRHPENVAVLIEAGADANVEDNVGMTALHAALTVRPHPKKITALIKGGADANKELKDGQTLLMQALMRRSDPKVITALVNGGADVNAKDHNGFTALLIAARMNNSQVIEILLEAGADVNAKNRKGQTPLDLAREMNYTRVVAQLTKAGAPLGRGVDLFALAESGTLAQVKAAIEAGANVNAKDDDGNTPLMRAAGGSGNHEVLATLISLGADATARNHKRQTALDLAREQKNTRVLNEFIMIFAESGTPEQVQAAINAGANVNARNILDWSPLMIAAARSNNPQVIAVLVEAGAEIDATADYSGDTPLMVAAWFNKNPSGVATALLRAGVDANAKNKDGKTALDIARENNNTQMINELTKAEDQPALEKTIWELVKVGTVEEVQAAIDAGADVNAKDAKGMTPLMYAVENPDRAVGRALMKAGADPTAENNKGQNVMDIVREQSRTRSETESD